MARAEPTTKQAARSEAQRTLRSEYSRLRSIAQKRSSRLTAAGLPGAKQFATLKELGDRNIKREIAKVQKFLSSERSTLPGARAAEDARKAARREAARKRRELTPEQKKFAQYAKEKLTTINPYGEKVVSGRLTQKQIKAFAGLPLEKSNLAITLAKYGIHPDTQEELKAWGAYIEARKAADKDSMKYMFDLWVNSLDELEAKDDSGKQITKKEILADFQHFYEEQKLLKQKYEEEKYDYSKSEFDNLWNRYTNKKGYSKQKRR